MDAKRLTEWVTSIHGLSTALVGVLSILALAVVTATDTLGQAFAKLGLSYDPRASQWLVVILIALVSIWVWKSYRRFAGVSRVARPECFELKATSPQDLIGRENDLQQLLRTVRDKRIVILDGESGCGKSALINAGLIPALRGTDYLPVLIDDWRDDWVNGPLRTTLYALYNVLTPEERGRLGWAQEPNLSVPTDSLVDELDRRLSGVATLLKRITVIIADQFDDYQARHKTKFHDEDGNKLSPLALAEANPFWGIVRARLKIPNSRTRLLAVTRVDSSGSSCLRFLKKEDSIVERTLPRIDSIYLRQLLDGIASSSEGAGVINPAGGWNDLVERLERDLRAQGSVLVQQIRMIGLGLRHLPELTASAYKNHGQIRGMELLAVKGAIDRVGLEVGGDTARQTARLILARLVLPGGSSHSPKANRCEARAFLDITADHKHLTFVLTILQNEKLIYPTNEGTAWQLAHDYLAAAVIADARHADRWGTALREGLESFRRPGNTKRQTWRALLPLSAQMGVVWERLRGRLVYGEAASYVTWSLLKTGFMLGLIVILGKLMITWEHDRQITNAAQAIYERFGGANESVAVLDSWCATEAVRTRLYELILEDDGRLDRATRSAWPLAHGGLESSRLQESAELLRGRLFQEKDSRIANGLSTNYIEILSRISAQEDLKKEAFALRTCVLDEACQYYPELAYESVTQRLLDPSDVKTEVEGLRSCLVQGSCRGKTRRIGRVYANLISSWSDQDALRAEAKLLNEALREQRSERTAKDLADAYEAVLGKITDSAVIRAEASLMRSGLTDERGRLLLIAEVYAKSLGRLSPEDGAEIAAGTSALRAAFDSSRKDSTKKALANAYGTVARKLRDARVIKLEVAALKARLTSQVVHEVHVLEMYAAVAPGLDEKVQLLDAVATLRPGLDGFVARSQHKAYCDIVNKLADQTILRDELKVLRGLLEKPGALTVLEHAEPLLLAYAAIVGGLANQADIRSETKSIRAVLTQPLEKKRDDYKLERAIMGAYLTVASLLNEQEDIKEEAAALRPNMKGDSRATLNAYRAMMARVTDVQMLKSESAWLSNFLNNRRDSFDGITQTYAETALRLTDQADIRQAVAHMRDTIFSEEYAKLVHKLSDPLERSEEIESVRPFSGMEVRFKWPHSHYVEVVRLSESQDEVLKEFLKVQEVVLHNVQDSRRNNNGHYARGKSLFEIYAKLSQLVKTPNHAREVVSILRGFLDLQVDVTPAPDELTRRTIVEAYLAMATKLTNESDVRSEAKLLLAQIGLEGGALAEIQAYAGIAQHLTHSDDLEYGVVALRKALRQSFDLQEHPRLLRSGGRYSTDEIVLFQQAYIKVAKRHLELIGSAKHSKYCSAVKEHLMAAGYPDSRTTWSFRREALPLLPDSSRPDIGDAVAWWVANCNGDVVALRPAASLEQNDRAD